MQSSEQTRIVNDNGKPKFLRLCISQWRKILISVLAFAILGFIYSYIKPTEFDIEANVLITDDDKDANLMQSINMSDILLGNSTSADQEMALMTSHSQFRSISIALQTNISYVVRKNILKRIRVYSKSPLTLIASPEIADTLRNVLTFKVGVNKEGLAWVKAKDVYGDVIADVENQKFPIALDTDYGEFVIDKTQYYKPGKDLRMNISYIGYDHAAENLQKEIKCFIPSRKADIVSVTFRADNIDYGKSVVNMLVDEYNQQVINKNRKKAQRIADFLDQRIIKLAKELSTSESDIETYKRNNNLTAIEVDAEYFMAKKAEIETRLVESETMLQILEMTRQMMSDPQYQYAMIPVPTDAEAVANLVGEYNKLILERMKVESSAKPNSTMMRTINEQIEAMRKTVLSSIDRQIASARIMVNDAKSEASKSNKRLGEVPAQEREYIELKRNQQIIETLYLFMLKEREQASITIANALPKGVIVDRAFALIKPATPGKLYIVAVFAFIGIFIIPAWLYIKPILNNLINRFL